MKTERLALVLFGLMAAWPIARAHEGAAWQDLLGLSGTARGSFFTKDNTFVDAPGVECDSLWLTAKPTGFAGTKTYFDARVQGQFVDGNSKIRGDLREGYLEKSIGDLDLKLGRQIIVWGRADKINPTDSWSARNYKLLVTDDDDQRIGTSAVQAIWNVGNERLVAVWQPEFRPPVLPIPPPPAGMPIGSVVASPKANQTGLKLDHSGAGFDWSVSYAHAINRTPDLLRFGADASNAPRLGLDYRFADVWGADAAVPIGRFGFRGEVAYVHTRNPGGRDPLAQDDNLFAVVGVERTWEGELSVNVQSMFKRSFDYRGPDAVADPLLRPLAAQARLISNELAATMEGASLRLNYKALNETLETELSAAMWFEKHDSFIQLKLSYAFTDRLKGIVGGNLWSGPAYSFFGRLRRTSSAFVECRIGL